MKTSKGKRNTEVPKQSDTRARASLTSKSRVVENQRGKSTTAETNSRFAVYITEMQSRKEGKSAGALRFPSHREGPGIKGRTQAGLPACRRSRPGAFNQPKREKRIMHPAMLSHAVFHCANSRVQYRSEDIDRGHGVNLSSSILSVRIWVGDSETLRHKCI